MAEEVDPAILKKTQDILGTVIKRPPLTEKNLKRPPFRFLHDIITNVIKTTGFLKGLYTPEEMVSENIKDKDSKIAFLQKVIDVLSIVNNQPVNLKPSKVVAGHEAQKTNEFLQILGQAVKNKVDSKAAVQAILEKSGSVSNQKERRASVDKRPKNASEKTRSTTKAVDPSKKSSQSSLKDPVRGKDGDKTRSRSKDSKARDKDKTKDKTRSKREDSKNRDKPEPKREKSSKRTKEAEPEESKSETLLVEDEVVVPNGHIEENLVIENGDLGLVMEGESQMFNGESLMHTELPADELNEEEKVIPVNDASPQKELPQRMPSGHRSRPPSARSKRTRLGVENNEAKSEAVDTPRVENSILNLQKTDSYVREGPSPLPRPGSARPSSSRPAPPRIRIRHIVENDEPSTRPPTAKPAVENVILDQPPHSEDEEEETFFVAEEPLADLQLPELPVLAPEAIPEEDKGSLVKQLLETKKDLEGGSQQLKKTEIDTSQMSTVATQRIREATNKELEQLRNFIQSVSKTAYPLGRMLDYLQEDVDSMKVELKMWKEEHQQNLIALRREKNITESTLEPLRVQLDDLDQVVQDQLDANSALKATILRNEERIQRMLAGLRRKS